MDRFLKISVQFLVVASALCFSDLLIAATSTGNLAVSAIVLARCVIRVSKAGMVPQSTCDDGMKAVTTIEPYSQTTNPAAFDRAIKSSGAGSIITLTY